jgi:hypothetical protein
MDCKYKYNIVSVLNSTGIEVNIIDHPEDLEVSAYPIHPSFEKWKIYPNGRCHKRWKIATGILPGQGVQIEWKPKSSTPQNPTAQTSQPLSNGQT